MGALSNQLLVVTILAYLAAMLGYAAEYAFGPRGAVARAASRQLVAVGAAASSDLGGEVLPEPPPAAKISQRLGRGAVAFTLLGAAAHVGTLVTRGLAAHRVPWGNMYEFVLTV